MTRDKKRTNASLFLLLFGQTTFVICETQYGSWSACSKIPSSLDQNCVGTQTRTVTIIERDKDGNIVSTRTDIQRQGCLLTSEIIDGGYTPWGAWADCSTRCNKETTRTRTCHNPTPCNGGKDCSDFGRHELTKTCRPAIGEWSEWGTWKSCEMPSHSTGVYGTGTKIRERSCDSPPPVCGGDFCVGNSNETGNCRVVPECLTEQMFSTKFLREESPMVIYTSAQVDVYLLTKNICSTKVIISTYYDLYKMNKSVTPPPEITIGKRTSNVKFKFDPGEYDIGFYRLYAWIGYEKGGNSHWMEESMYVKIEHPPPHAFIKGGVGRTVGQGHVNFDARSVSYSLTKGPGDPSGLTFQWQCLGFLTKDIYKLLQFNIDSKLVFSDISETTKKWYETKFLNYIENKVAFIKGSSVSSMVKTLQNSGVGCKSADQIYVKAELNKYTPAASITTKPTFITPLDTDNSTGSSLIRKISTTESVSTVEITTAAETTTLETSTESCFINVTECVDHVQCLNDTETNSTECYNVTQCYSNLTACTVEPITTVPAPTYDSIPLTLFYDIMYMYDMESEPDLLLTTDHILPLPDNTTLIKNEMGEFINSLNDEESASFPDDTVEFFKLLSDSSLTLNSLYQLNGLSGLPESANETFFANLNTWLQNANVSKEFANELVDLLKAFKSVGVFVSSALDLVDLIGMDNFLRLSVDESGTCLVNHLGNLFNGFEVVDSYNWNNMKLREQFYLDWMQEELLNSSACAEFTGSNNGHGSLVITPDDVTDGIGFLVYLRVEFDGSVSYFIQHSQAVEGEPPDIEIECRLNCMKKTALTSIMSLKATCPTCSLHQQRVARFWWNVKNFDLFTRKAVSNTLWKSYMLSELESRRFVMKANVLDANSGYLIEAFVEINGRISSAIWIVNTNILPYNGTCELSDAYWEGEKNVSTYNWKDEGFRSSMDTSLDWKEQLNYRIVQTTSRGRETLLYYGSEEQNFIKLKPGNVEDNYEVNVKIQIYDIFIDYAECNIAVGQIHPDYKTEDTSSVSNFLTESSDSIDYYWKVKNIKQVGMNTEVAGTPVQDMSINSTILDTNPADWLNLGVVNTPDGSNTTQTFDQLWESYLNPDFGDVTTLNEVKEKLTNFSSILNDVSDLVSGASTVNLEQIAISVGTIVANKHFTENTSASNAFRGTHMLVDKLEVLAYNETYPKYEDFIQTCEGVLRVLNNALEALLPTMYADLPSELDIYAVMNDMSNREELSTDSGADLTTMEKAFIAQQIAMKNELEKSFKDDIVKNEVPTLLEDIRRLGHILAMLNYRKQMPVYVQNGYINSTENNKDIGELLQKGYQTNGVSLNFSASVSTPTGEQNVQVTLYDHTPFSWDKESSFITSKTVSVNVGKDNETDRAIPSTISIPNLNSTVVKKTITLAIPIDDEPTSQLILYKFFWKTPSDTAIVEIGNALTVMNHTVYLRKKLPPDPSANVYDQVFQVEPLNWKQDKIKLVIAGGLYSKPINVYIGVLVQQGNSTISKRRRRRSISTTTYINYEITTLTTGCRVWDDTAQKWDKSSCQLSTSSTVSDTVCVCSNPPGNNFATTFYVPPNTIDFGTVFQKFNLKDNAAVFATVISLIALYLLVSVWAIRQDRNDVERWALSYLVDNGPHDEYLYIISVFTGLNRHAGTTSKVFFMIIDGKNRRNDNLSIRCLEGDKHQGFGVGSIRRFVMSVPAKIKDPSVIKIWHDNSGEGNSASWYLDKIVLEDVQTSARYMFICDRWLSLDNEDGCIDCAIPICNQSEVHKFSFLFNEKSKQNTTDGHLWLSVVIRPEDSNFSRMERLACCLALLFLTMISNAMFYGQDTGGTVQLGPISFSLTGIYISIVSALIVAPPIFFVSFFFRKSRKRVTKRHGKKNTSKFETKFQLKLKTEETQEEKLDVTNNSDFPLPFWCRYIAWIFITVAVLLSGFFLILYSMEWGKSKAEAWLACFFLSFFESIIIVDPLKIILMSVILSWIVKSYNVDTIKYDKEKLLRETKRHTSTPLSYLLDVYKRKIAPVRPSKIEKMKEQRRFKLRVQKTFIELLLYATFLTVLYLVSYSNRDSRWFNLKNHIDNHLITPTNVSAGTATIKFNEIHASSHLYKWLNETLLPYVFPRFESNGKTLIADKRRYVEDQVNFRVGPMRLRQVRSNSEQCVGYRFESSTCFESYSILNEDNQNYCVGWNSPPCNIGQNVMYLTSAAWNFISSIDIWGFPVNGFHTIYNGGGFISEFMVNFNVSRKMLNELYENAWIDRKTRAVFTEFTLYNADNNVFTYTSLLCEFAVTGGALTSYNIQLFRPYQHVGNLGLFVFICELIVFVGIIIFSGGKMIYIYRHGKRILKEFWNMLDIIIIILFILCTIMYIGRWIMINLAIEKFEEDKNKFVNFSHISYWDELFNIFLSFTIFFTSFRMMRVLSYNERINQLSKVLAYVSRELCGCFVMFLIVYVAFTMFGYLVFGRELDTYKNLMVSSTTLVNAIIGKNSINDLFSIEPVLGRMYYFCFVLFLLWILMTMLNASLNFGITAIRSKPVPSFYGISDIVYDIWKSAVGLIFQDNKPSPKKTKNMDSEIISTERPTDIDIIKPVLSRGFRNKPRRIYINQ